MKKWLIIFTILAVIAFAGVSFFIPSTLSLRASVSIKAARPALYRLLQDPISISKWWPGYIDSSGLERKFMLNKNTYAIGHNNVSLVPITIVGNGLTNNTALYLIPYQSENVSMEWVNTITMSHNPFTKLVQYLEARNTNRDMQRILEEAHKYFSVEANIYELNIVHSLITDSTFLFTEGISHTYPSTYYIYSLIEKLKIYSSHYNAEQTNYPILNITNIDSTNYLIKVAIPVSKDLPSKEEIESKRMPVNVKILVADVYGGSVAAANAFTQMQLYITDRNLQVPGLPFFSLVTDRSQESDSSKWLTRVCFPVR